MLHVGCLPSGSSKPCVPGVHWEGSRREDERRGGAFILMRNSERRARAIEGRVYTSSDVLYSLYFSQVTGVARLVRDDGAVGRIDSFIYHIQHVILPVQGQPGRRVSRSVERGRLGQIVATVWVLEQRQGSDVASVRGNIEVHGTRETHEGGESEEKLWQHGEMSRQPEMRLLVEHEDFEAISTSAFLTRMCLGSKWTRRHYLRTTRLARVLVSCRLP
jgi:hypothetical protein